MPHASRSTGSMPVPVQQAIACGLPEVFHVSPRSRSIARVDLRRWCDHASDRSEVFRQQANDVTCLVLRVYASQWNWACTAFEHVETKTEEVVFSRRSWLSFIVGVRSELVRSYDGHLPEVLPWLNFTPDLQQVQAERFSFQFLFHYILSIHISLFFTWKLFSLRTEHLGTANGWYLQARVHRNKSMQRLISSVWGPGTAKFQVTWLLRIVQNGVSVW